MKFISFHLLLHLNSFRSPPPDKYTDRYTSPLPLPRQASLYATTLSWQTEANKRTFGKATVQRAAPVTLSGVLSHRGKVFGIKAMELLLLKHLRKPVMAISCVEPSNLIESVLLLLQKRCVVFDGKTWQKAGEHFFFGLGLLSQASFENKYWNLSKSGVNGLYINTTQTNEPNELESKWTNIQIVGKTQKHLWKLINHHKFILKMIISST